MEKTCLLCIIFPFLFLVKSLDDQLLADAGFTTYDDVESGLGHPIDDLPDASYIFAHSDQFIFHKSPGNLSHVEEKVMMCVQNYIFYFIGDIRV